MIKSGMKEKINSVMKMPYGKNWNDDSLVWFYDTSTNVGYLMPNPFLLI